MKQQCHLAMIWLSWAIYAGGAAAALSFHNWFFAGFWIILAPLAMGQYIRRFPAISGAMGYGSVADAPAPRMSPKRRISRSRSTPRSAAPSAL